MKNYFKKSFSYLIYLVVLFSLIYWIMVLTSTTTIAPSQLGLFFSSKSGYLVIGFALVISLAYPFFGFTKKSVRVNDIDDMSAVERVMAVSGYELVGEEGKKRFYRPIKKFSRLRMLFNDIITVDMSYNPVEIEGNRTAATILAMRLENEQR